MLDLERQKQMVALQSVGYVQNGMLIGLGSGQTAAYAISEIGSRIRRGELYVNAVATSEHSAELALQAGISVIPYDGALRVDLTIDGADEIGPGLDLIKGGRGALLREKILAANSDQVIILGDSRKPVKALGKASLSIEVVPFGWVYAARQIRELFGVPVVRRRDTQHQVVVTDEGNHILDCVFGQIADPAAMSRDLNNIPGVVENGLFVGLTTLAIVIQEERVQELDRKWDGITN